MPQSVDRDDRDVTGFALPAENVVHRRIIDSADGVPIGNYLSQYFANKFNLSKIAYIMI